MAVLVAGRALGCLCPVSQCLGFCRGLRGFHVCWCVCLHSYVLRVVELHPPSTGWLEGELSASRCCWTGAWRAQRWALTWNKRESVPRFSCWIYYWFSFKNEMWPFQFDAGEPSSRSVMAGSEAHLFTWIFRCGSSECTSCTLGCLSSIPLNRDRPD